MTPADELRAAAKLIRDMAAPCEPGPWQAELPGRGRAWINLPVYKHGIPCHGFTEEAQWIALMGPDKAEVIAAWLEIDAEEFEAHYADRTADDRWPPLAFARSILGGAA